VAYLLHIETATQVCSVALSLDGRVLSCLESHEKNSHSAVLTLLINELLNQEGMAYSELDAVAVSMGPGSYTGLRIGVSAAKGFCYALDIPMISVPTLQSMAAGASGLPGIQPGSLLCPMIDARRMEVYTAVFNQNLQEVMETQAMIVTENSFLEYLADYPICFIGDGAAKTRDILEKLPNVFYPAGFEVSAKFMCGLSWKKFLEKDFEDVAYFEPYYLKDFIAGKPRVRGL